MNRDDFSRVKSQLEPPWDEVKEQRVLARVMAERKAAPRVRPLLVVMPVAAALAIAAAVVLFVVPRHHAADAPTASQTPSAPPTNSVAAPVAPPSESVMALADGSQAFMLRDAGIQVEEQREDRVRIAQRRGAVRYEVRHDPSREFAVRAGGATVRVRGTIFTVDLKADVLEVSVQRGRVEVDDGARTREISGGETLRLPAQSEGSESVPDAAPVEPATLPVAPSAPSHVAGAAELQARADRARVRGNLPEAAAALESLVATYPHDARVPAALFSLARVERSRGREAAAARAFERCLKVAPGGPLAEDALAEAAVSWSAAGVADSARADANSYLARFPSGTHAARMKAILGH